MSKFGSRYLWRFRLEQGADEHEHTEQGAFEMRDSSTEAFHGLVGDAGRALAMVVGVPGHGGWSIGWEAGVSG